MNQEKILTLIDSPYITEKASKLASEKNQVVFKVNINANKLEIKKAQFDIMFGQGISREGSLLDGSAAASAVVVPTNRHLSQSSAPVPGFQHPRAAAAVDAVPPRRVELNVGSVLWSVGSRSKGLWTDVLSDGLYGSVLSDSPQRWLGPRPT